MSEIRSQKKKNLVRGVIIGAIVTVLLLIGGFVWFASSFVMGPPATITEDINDYNIIFKNHVYSGLMVFPDKVPASATDAEFYYYWRDTLFDPTSQIYMSCKYSPEDFEAEKNRISSINKTSVLKTVKIREDNREHFKHPTYIAVSNDNHCYEYATVLKEESRIIYVFTMFIPKNKVKFPKEYLPDNFWSNNKGEEKFSLYNVSTDSTGTVTDFSRKSIVTEKDSHVVQKSYYSMAVHTEYVTKQKEVISGCILRYFKLEPYKEESWKFDDLNGCTYISIEEAENGAKITYEKDAQRKEVYVDYEKHTLHN